MSDRELLFILDAIAQVVKNHGSWANDYIYDKHTNEFRHEQGPSHNGLIRSWFSLEKGA
jgi:hypothetical protein